MYKLQVITGANRAVSSVQTARRRRPGVGFKLGQDKPLLNETLGPTTVERDARCEYRGGKVTSTTVVVNTG
jgi:hypothetical protein